MTMMGQFDFTLPADVFVDGRFARRRKRMTYLRFGSGAEAIRHVIETQDGDRLAGTIIEVDEVRIAGAEIRGLYDSPEYPLPRKL